MPSTLPTVSYSLHELRRLCRHITRISSDIELDRHRLVIHDIHPDYVPAGNPVHEHVHSFYEGHIFLEGGGTYVTGREEFVGAYGTLLHEPHAPHAWAAGDVSCLRVLFWFSMEPMVLIPKPEVWPIWPDLAQEFLYLLDDVHEQRPGWHLRVKPRLTVLFSQLLSMANWPNTPVPVLPASTDLVTIIEQFFLDNLARPLTLSDVATHVGISERTLCRQFTDITGETVMERLLNLRMDRAATLLAETDDSLAAIGMSVGIAEASYFCRRFRRHFNKTPNQYRVEIRQAVKPRGKN